MEPSLVESGEPVYSFPSPPPHSPTSLFDQAQAMHMNLQTAPFQLVPFAQIVGCVDTLVSMDNLDRTLWAHLQCLRQHPT
jgi:hypothetical protein